MSSTEAKLHLSLEDGVFEISGSELFVSQQIENFKDIILESLHSRKHYTIETNQLTKESAPPAAEPLAEGAKSEHGFDKKSFPRVLHIEGKNVRIIKKMPGSTSSKKSINTALAYLWGKRSVGEEGISYQEIRDLCQQQGCLDSANFSATIKGAREYIIIEGKKGSSAQTCKLTLPGVERAEELLEDLNGE
ncbi:hypothetical protein EUZ85_28625 [Hahella sp. KA22]|uniref:hypothetical protein n=1 Tax=Hahella sp. KA22 TaxID=1628392 RepID=UPI000FDCDF60|nr:hypothetical protein [Hahella sp. KA22]AZZ94462.1 hypothetical protein ENC22_26040 [Hahella sp. KA22]QAY57835.1 hypothetical protein EUZ85_28625 [Hahella sp. KA22]